MSGMPQRHSRLRNRSLRRAASSEQHEPASGVGFPIPTRPGARAGRPSQRGELVREAGDVVAQRRGLQRTHARPGLLPSLRLLRTPGIYPWGGLVLIQAEATHNSFILGLPLHRPRPCPAFHLRSSWIIRNNNATKSLGILAHALVKAHNFDSIGEPLLQHKDGGRCIASRLRTGSTGNTLRARPTTEVCIGTTAHKSSTRTSCWILLSSFRASSRRSRCARARARDTSRNVNSEETSEPDERTSLSASSPSSNILARALDSR